MGTADIVPQWYVSRHGETHGPLSALDLALLAGLGHLQPSDQIWSSDLPGWIEAGSVDGLLSRPEPQPPARFGFSEALANQIPSAVPVPQPVDPLRRADVAARPVAPDRRRVADPTGTLHRPALTRVIARRSQAASPPWPVGGLPDGMIASPPRDVTSAAQAGPFPAQVMPVEPAPLTSDLWPQPLPAGHAPVPAAPGLLGRLAGSVSSVSMAGVIDAVRHGAAQLAAMAPSQVQAALQQLDAFGWDNLVDAMADAFDQNQVRRVEHLMNDDCMRETARLVLDKLPFSARLCISITIGEKGFEGFVFHIRDNIQQRMAEETLQEDISTVLRRHLRSAAIRAQCSRLFEDLKARLLQPLLARQAPEPVPQLPAPPLSPAWSLAGFAPAGYLPAAAGPRGA